MLKEIFVFLVVFVTVISDVKGLLAGGINVCTAYQKQSRSTNYNCGLFGLWRCKKSVYYRGASYYCCSGFHSRDNLHCDYANTCGYPGDIQNGYFTGNNFSFGGTVSYSCNDGFAIAHGNNKRTCQKQGYWSGIKPTCSVVDPCSKNDCMNGGSCVASGDVRICNCPPGWQGETCQNRTSCNAPDGIKNGYIIVDNYLFESSITYACNENFNLTNGNATQVCKSDGTWSGYRPSCIQSNTCVSNPCKNQGTCIDGLGIYTCICPHGWSGVHCQNDILSPTIEGCQTDTVIYGQKPLQEVNWTKPVFEDPRGGPIQITANYDQESYIFPYGIFPVYYEAVKPNTGLKSTCKFEITVLPYPCDELNIPRNGARVCSNWATRFGKFCKAYCHPGFETPLSETSNSLFVCGTSGHWKPAKILPNCTESDTSFVRAEDRKLSCDDAGSITAIKKQFLLSLQNSHFSYFCRHFQDECNEQNVSVQC